MKLSILFLHLELVRDEEIKLLLLVANLICGARGDYLNTHASLLVASRG